MGSNTRCGEIQHLFVLDRGLTAKIRQDGDFTIFFHLYFCCGTEKAISQVFLDSFCDVVGRAK